MCLSRAALRGRGPGLFIRLGSWGWRWQGMEVGGVGGREERRGLTTRAMTKACAGAGRGEWKATVCRSGPALAGRSGPYKEMLFSLSASGAGTEPSSCAHRTELPCGEQGCHPPLAVSARGVKLNGPLACSAFPLRPSRPAAPTPERPPWCPGLIGGKEKQNKTKTWPDFRPR